VKVLKLFLEQIGAGNLINLVIVGVALLVILGALYAVGMARRQRLLERQETRRCGYKHRLRQSRPMVVYEGRIPRPPAIRRRVTREEDPWMQSARERA
jgi:hypothetical protein